MVRIIFLNPPSYIPDSYKDADGQISLDLNEGEKVALTRVIDDYVDIGKIKQDTFKELTVPVTKKNRLLFGNIGNPSALNEFNNEVFDIQLLKGDFSYPVSGLQVVGLSDTDSEYSVTIFGELNEWYRPLSNLFLNEIELGSATVDYVWINARHNDNYEFSDSSFPVFPPLVNYGKWFVNCNIGGASEAQAQVVFNNWRFWFSPLAVLRQAFCQIGHKLIAPVLETEEFRRKWCYLLDANFETANQDDVANRPFERQANNPLSNIFEVLFFVYSNGSTGNGVLLFGDVISDPGSHTFSNIPTGTSTDNYYGMFYSGGIIGNFSFNGTVRLRIPSGALIPVQPDFVTLRVSIKKSFKFGVENQFDMQSKSQTLAEKEIVFKNIFVGGINYDNDFVLDSGTIKVYEHEIVFVQVELVANLVDGGGAEFNETVFYDESQVLPGCTFKNTVEQQVIEQGDTLSFGKMMRTDVTALDLLKGIAHLLSLKIDNDSVSKTVSLYPEFPFEWYTSGEQEGFFLPNTDSPFDATLKIEADSMRQDEFRNTDLEREVYLRFLSSSDGYITRQNLTDELHSKRFDLGPKYRDGQNEIINPFFEPLDIGFDNQLGGLEVTFGPGDVRPSANLIPFMWESEPTEDDVYPEIGFDYAPRIAIAYPLPNSNQFEPELTGYDDLTISFFVYEDTPTTFYNLFGQIFPDGVNINEIGVPLYSPELAVVYGNGKNPDIRDYYTMFYDRIVNQAYFGLALDFLVLLDLCDFTNLSFRTKWKVKYLSKFWGEIVFFARLSQVQDYVIGENLTTPVELIPDNNNFENC